MSDNSGPEYAARREALELFIKALAAKPEMYGGSADGKDAAKDIVKGAEVIRRYLNDGELPTASDKG